MDNLNIPEVMRHFMYLDLLCHEENVTMEITIFGGTAFLLRLGEENFRFTMDIDYKLEGISREDAIKDILAHLPAIFQNLGGFPFYPDRDMYKEDLTLYEFEQKTFTNLRLNLPSIEMLALSKLMSSRGKDLDDLLELPILEKCDLEKLSNLSEECKSYMTDYEYHQSNYSEWENILLKRGLPL